MLGATMLRVVGQQCCACLHGPYAVVLKCTFAAACTAVASRKPDKVIALS